MILVQVVIYFRVDTGTSVLYAFEYLIGLATFGLFYWLLNGILPAFAGISTQDDVYQFAMWAWRAAVVIYLLFGMFYFFRSIKTWMVRR